MNILFISPCWPAKIDKPNGIVSYLEQMVPTLRQQGHVVCILAMENTGEVTEQNLYFADWNDSLLSKSSAMVGELLNPGYYVYRIGVRNILRSINLIAAEHRIDIIEMEESFGWHYEIQKRVNIPVVMRLHGPHYINGLMTGNQPDRNDKLRIRREARAIRSSRSVSAPSEWVLDSVKQATNANWPRYKTIANPAPKFDDINVWDISKIKRGQILFVGRFDRHKGGDIVLKAFARLMRTRPDLTLIFAGPDSGIFEGGVTHDFSSYANKLFSKSEIARINYLGAVSREKVVELRMQSHVTLIASRKENFPYTALEALAFGSPVVAAKVGGIAEIFEERQSGLFFEPESEIDLAAKVCELIDDNNLLNELSKGALARAKTNFGVSKLAENTIEFYESVLRASRECAFNLDHD